MIGQILALDLGSVTGFAIVDEGGRVASGSRDFTKRIPAGAQAVERHAIIFDRFAQWLPDLLSEWQPSLLVMEDSSGNLKGQAARVLCGLRALVLVAAHRREILIDVVNRAEWQCWGRANGWSRADKSDESDSLWLGVYWHTVRGGSVQVGLAA